MGHQRVRPWARLMPRSVARTSSDPQGMGSARARCALEIEARWRIRWPLGTRTLAQRLVSLPASRKRAVSVAPLAHVVALRETPVLFGAALGALVLKEPFGRYRIMASAVVAAGAVLLNLGR